MLRWLRHVRVWTAPTLRVEGDSRPAWQRLVAFIGVKIHR